MMRTLYLLLLVVVLVMLFSGCATMGPSEPIAIQSAELGNYQTFNFLPKQIDYTQSLLTDKRIETAIETQLLAEGFEKQTSDHPDLLVTFHTNVKGKVDVERFGYHYSWTENNIGTSTSEPYYKHAALIIDIIDAKNKKLIWRGWEKAGEREVIARIRIAETTTKILNQFLQKETKEDSTSI